METSWGNTRESLKAVFLNTEAWLRLKQGRIQLAERVLERAKDIEKRGKLSSIEEARTLFGLAIVRLRMDSEIQAATLVAEGLSLLRSRPISTPECAGVKFGEVLLGSFHNIVNELIALRREEWARLVQKEGLWIAVESLGKDHKVTKRLKSILRGNKELGVRRGTSLGLRQRQITKIYLEGCNPMQSRGKQQKGVLSHCRPRRSLTQHSELMMSTSLYLRTISRTRNILPERNTALLRRSGDSRMQRSGDSRMQRREDDRMQRSGDSRMQRSGDSRMQRREDDRMQRSGDSRMQRSGQAFMRACRYNREDCEAVKMSKRRSLRKRVQKKSLQSINLKQQSLKRGEGTKIREFNEQKTTKVRSIRELKRKSIRNIIIEPTVEVRKHIQAIEEENDEICLPQLFKAAVQQPKQICTLI